MPPNRTLRPVPPPPRPPPDLTPGQLWRHRRNVVIALARHQGASIRLLGEVFGLPRSRIRAILAELRESSESAGR